MKMMYGNVPVTNLQIVKHDVSTDDATMFASDLQAGVTAYARGQKITGTGKCFEFANYGSMSTNMSDYVPSDINIIHMSSVDKPVQMSITLYDMKNQSFNTPLEVGKVLVDGVLYPITVLVENNFLSVTCEQTVTLELFYGKDNYV